MSNPTEGERTPDPVLEMLNLAPMSLVLGHVMIGVAEQALVAGTGEDVLLVEHRLAVMS